MPPVIGITARCLRAAHPSQGVKVSYIRAIVCAGGIPVILPLMESAPALGELCKRLDGLLLPGGEDVGPELYNEARHERLEETSAERDASELAIFRAACGQRIPILGICRGAHLINVSLGGTLYQDIGNQCPWAGPHRAGGTLEHDVEIVENSLLESIVQQRKIRVNSFHHQAVRELAPGLRVAARAPDGVIEAFEGTDTGTFLIGIQWHAEMYMGGPAPEKILKKLVEVASLL